MSRFHKVTKSIHPQKSVEYKDSYNYSISLNKKVGERFLKEEFESFCINDAILLVKSGCSPPYFIMRSKEV